MNDNLDTDCRCETEVSSYFLHNDDLKQLRLKYQELDKALEEYEMFLV